MWKVGGRVEKRERSFKIMKIFTPNVASKLYGLDATIIIFVFVLYCKCVFIEQKILQKTLRFYGICNFIRMIF